MIPHVTGEVKHRLRKLAMTGGPDGGPADVVFVEVGGTVGDYENGFYIEALRELAFEEGPDSTCFVALTYVIEPPILGEQKSKAAQLGIKRLMEAGIQPHIVACRAATGSRTRCARRSRCSRTCRCSASSRCTTASRSTRSPRRCVRRGSTARSSRILELHDRVDPADEDRARKRLEPVRGDRSSPRDGTRSRSASSASTPSLRDAYASIDKAIEHASTHLSADGRRSTGSTRPTIDSRERRRACSAERPRRGHRARRLRRARRARARSPASSTPARTASPTSASASASRWR